MGERGPPKLSMLPFNRAVDGTVHLAWRSEMAGAPSGPGLAPLKYAIAPEVASHAIDARRPVHFAHAGDTVGRRQSIRPFAGKLWIALLPPACTHACQGADSVTT